jgi:DNA-binding protein H-NS
MKEIIIDVLSASLVELIEAKKLIESAIVDKQNKEKSAIKTQIRQLAKTYNLSVEDVLEKGGKDNKAVKSVKPKYQHPENAALQWTGRGRQPLWVKALNEQGIDIESMKIVDDVAA